MTTIPTQPPTLQPLPTWGHSSRVQVLQAILEGYNTANRLIERLPNLSKSTVRAALYDLREGQIIQTVKVPVGQGCFQWQEAFDPELAKIFLEAASS